MCVSDDSTAFQYLIMRQTIPTKIHQKAVKQQQ